MLTFSASKIKTYQSCGKKYEYTYITGTERERNLYLAMGSALHIALENDKRCADDPFEAYKESWREFQDLDGWGKKYTEGEKILQRTILHDYAYQAYIPVQIEYYFQFPLNEDIAVEGVIDLITEQEEIIDYKSGRNKPNKEMLQWNMQFLIYQMAYEALYKKPAKHTYWHHLRTGDRIEVEPLTAIKREYVARELINLYNTQMYSGVYERKITEDCAWCFHKELCFRELNAELQQEQI